MPFIRHTDQPWTEIRPGVKWQFITGHFAAPDERVGPGLTMFYQVVQPGFGVPRHRHECGDESMTVLEGRVQALVDGEVEVLEPGTTVLVPEGKVHSFRNAGDSELRVMFVIAASALRPEFLEDPKGVPAAY
ncbi:MAG TPA: cupin domain-containing protein [Chloroflexota bacterium]|jgi:quercetin dioxygenase-like cupin family protein